MNLIPKLKINPESNSKMQNMLNYTVLNTKINKNKVKVISETIEGLNGDL